MRRPALARTLAIAPTLCAAVTALLIAFAPAANAQRVLTREAGSVRMIYAPWEGALEPRIVRAGDEAWAETLIIDDAVRLERDVPARVRPGALAAQSGTVLYGYQLLRGAAYCVPFDLSTDHVRSVQCFRDFNDDSIFDGTYVAEILQSRRSCVPAACLCADRSARRYQLHASRRERGAALSRARGVRPHERRRTALAVGN
ncbi:MAG: hypothetical protein M0D54_04115 [Hyphomonadaceae bacterium JAD_PAG50586_4]|nr:MAG: hypothetical protein M0D54_04115 [Hyphomonadaceae bacterium JAD_PAG50586_4]